MICITRILTFQDKWQRLDMASDLLLHAALHLRKRHADAPRIIMDGTYMVDMAAANNLLVLSREIYQDSTDRMICDPGTQLRIELQSLLDKY